MIKSLTGVYASCKRGPGCRDDNLHALSYLSLPKFASLFPGKSQEETMFMDEALRGAFFTVLVFPPSLPARGWYVASISICRTALVSACGVLGSLFFFFFFFLTPKTADIMQLAVQLPRPARHAITVSYQIHMWLKRPVFLGKK